MKTKFTQLISALFIMAIFIPGLQAQKVKGNGKMIQKTRNVGDFDKLGVAGSFDVTLAKGEEGKIELNVEENLEPYLETKVKDGKLTVGWKKGTNINTSKKTTVKVYFQTIEGVALAGSGDVIGEDEISGDKLDVAIAGSGDITLKLKTGELKSAISGSGDIVFSGSADTFEGAIAGSGDVKAEDLKVNKADLKISGSGSFRVNVSNELSARVAGSGDIRYKGSPKVEDIKVSGSGSVSTF